MRILQVITSLQTGGAEKLIIEFVPRLRAIGYDVDVCLFNGVDTPFKRLLQQTGCGIYCLSCNDVYYHPVKILRLWQVMKRYDIVHTHNTAPQFFAAIASKMTRSASLVTTEHNTSNRRRVWKWYPLWLDKWMYRQYKRVVCISDQAEANLREFINVAPYSKQDNICTIYNGVDVEVFSKASINKELRNSTNRFVSVMVAGFREQKDQDTLIRAISLLPKDKYEVWLVGDGERRKSLEAIVQQMGMNDNVRFFGIRTDVSEILKAADVVVMSSHYEGLSLSNVEGMSAGKPFLASDVDGLREVTRNYGLLFPHGDEKQLADIIGRLHDDKNFYNEVATRCYERAKQFDITKTVNGYMAVYEELIK